MSSMQNLLAWIKTKSKSSKNGTAKQHVYAPVPDSPTEGRGDGPFLQGSSRASVCRASMKLPPVPHGDVTCQILAATGRRPQVPVMGVSSLRTDSPAHIYEEIPNHLVEDSDAVDNASNELDVNTLDLAQAKDFGSFVVVPIRSRSSEEVHNKETNNNRTEYPSSSSCDHGSVCHDAGSVSSSPQQERSCSPAEPSHHHHSHFSHCTRCRRPHGIFNGITLSHLGGEQDQQSLDLQTYFDRHMLQQEAENGNVSVVDRFLIVPSMQEDTSDVVENADLQQEEHSEEIDKPSHDKIDPPPSSDSNDTCNEYDLRSSDRSSTSHSRPGSYAFDSGSSLYAFSNSDKDNSLVSKAGLEQEVRHKPQESDSSNDTFSEYDVHTSPEYEYYLSKAQHNLWLKKDVMRVIRESESSEYETTSDTASVQCCCIAASPENLSLTTVTSLSDLSLSDKDDVQHSSKIKSVQDVGSCITCSHHSKHEKIKHTRQKAKKKHKHSTRHRHEQLQPKEQSSSEDYSSNLPAWERPDRKGSHSRRGHSSSSRRQGSSGGRTAELYCLPDFSDSLTSGNMVQEPDRLSCRATDFVPPKQTLCSTKLKPHTPHVPPAVEPQGRLRSRRMPQQNRILTDLMKMNHDRLLVLF